MGKSNLHGLLSVFSCISHKHISLLTKFVVNTPKPTRGDTRCTYTPRQQGVRRFARKVENG